jgi:predicted amidohydrolase YtcJ
MEVAIRRVDPGDRENAPFLPSECLSLDDALTGFTAGTTFVNHDTADGVLTVGARADFAVLDQDLYELDGKVADASVLCTVASGSLVYGDY